MSNTPVPKPNEYTEGKAIVLESTSNAGNSLNQDSIETLREKNSNALNLIRSRFVVAIGGITLMALLLITGISFSSNRALKRLIESSSDYTEKEKIEQIKDIDSEFNEQTTDLFLGIFLLALGYFVGSSGSNKK